jgi:hypothetical protein
MKKLQRPLEVGISKMAKDYLNFFCKEQWKWCVFGCSSEGWWW